MQNPPETTDGRATPHASQAALVRALMLERFGGLDSSSALEGECHVSAPESAAFYWQADGPGAGTEASATLEFEADATLENEATGSWF